MRGRPRILIGFVGIVAVVVVLVELFFSSEAQKPGEYRTTARVKQPPAILHSFSQRTTRSNRNRGSKLGKDTLVQSRSAVSFTSEDTKYLRRFLSIIPRQKHEYPCFIFFSLSKIINTKFFNNYF